MDGFGRIRWALRKVFLPVSADGLVLDVGSGGCPYPRSDVLLEKYTGALHRTGSALIADRPLVLGDAERMPFKDKAFDFVVASHILEHMREPERFLGELMRVAKAGYIETPSFLFERLIPYDIHCLEISDVGGRLRIHKKAKARDDEFLGSVELFQRDKRWARLFHSRPDMFHVRYFWRDQIDFEVENPDTSCDWLPEAADDTAAWSDRADQYKGSGWRARGLRTLRRIYELSARRKVDLDQLLVCPSCRVSLWRQRDHYSCESCRATFAATPVPSFVRPQQLAVK